MVKSYEQYILYIYFTLIYVSLTAKLISNLDLGLMISGLAFGGAAVNNKQYIERAADAAKFIKEYLFDETKNILLHSCYRDEKGMITQMYVYYCY